MSNEVFIQVIDMDTMVHEQVISNADGSYTILLNSRLSHFDNVSGYYHAMYHINHNDFERSDVNNIELEAHSLNSYKGGTA